MFSVRLRHRAEPTTSAPFDSAYSAMWLPTNPVMPVMSSRMLAMLQEVGRRGDYSALHGSRP